MSDPAATTFQASDVAFATRAGEALLARVYRPPGAGPFPAVLDIHGGAWAVGTRLSNAAIDEFLAARGLVVVAPDFRQSSTARYPEPVVDINAAIRWCKAHATELGTTPDRIGGLGTSSGGHQLLLAALRPDDPRYVDPDGAAGEDARLPYLIACWPVADPAARYAMAVAGGVKELIDAHAAYWPTIEAMDDGNPQRIVESGAAGPLPPLLLVTGTADENMPADAIARFEAAYRAAGGDATTARYADEKHAFITRNASGTAAADALGVIDRFIRRHAGAGGG